MNRKLTSVPLLILVLTFAEPCSAPAERKPLARLLLTKIEHEPTRITTRYNPQMRQSEKYNPEGRIVYEEKSGNFLVQWVGIDGKRKTVVYDPATQLDAVVAATVEYDASANLYRYSYTLSNLSSSQRKLQGFYLETKTPIQNAGVPDTTWRSFGRLTNHLRETLTIGDGLHWAQTRHGRLGLLPGEKAAGFSFQSVGLPAIVRCFVDHNRTMRGVGEEMPGELEDAIFRVSWKIPQGVTVGPAAVPERVEPIAFARQILAMIDTSTQQGWIESPQVTQELRKLLASAVATLEQGDRKRASSVLRAVLETVEREKGRTLLSEAYALLRFNVAFLLTRIGG